jgi:uncharacterized protein
MKKVVILHGTGGKSGDQWFPWLKEQLINKGCAVWVPDLPGADEPDINVYNRFLEANCPFEIDKNTIIVGHSSGAVATFGWLQTMDKKIEAKKVISVAGFVDDLDYQPVKKMFASWKFNWNKIRSRAKKFIAVCSDDDPYVPSKHANELKRLVGAEIIVMPGQKHFSVSTAPKYTKFPELLDLI